MKRDRRILGCLLCFASAALAGEAPAGKEPDPLDALEKQMGELLNRDRAKHGLPPLTYDRKLAAVARAHSQDMRDHGFFSHESKTTGKVQDRLRRARVPFRGAGENIAKCGPVETAQAALMISPKHRDNILGTEFTRFGVGIVLDDDGTPVCTQVFTQVPPVQDVTALQTQTLDAINRERLARGLRRLVPDDTLTRQAQSHSERAARLGQPDEMWLQEQLIQDGARWHTHEVLYVLTDTMARVTSSVVALSARYDYCGLAIVQAPLDSKASGALWVTLICAQKK